MANRNYATDYVVHACGAGACNAQRAHDRVASEVRSDATCKRCLASLAKRDRAFQRKARGWYRTARSRAIDRSHAAYTSGRLTPWTARAAIATEEGDEP